MKDELIALAKRKGFRSKFLSDRPYFPDKPWLMPEREELRYELWMCELEVWMFGAVSSTEYSEIVNSLKLLDDAKE